MLEHKSVNEVGGYPQQTNSRDRVIRTKQAAAELGVHRSTLYRWVRGGRFPKPIKMGPDGTRCGASGWLASEVDKWLAEQVAASRQTH